MARDRVVRLVVRGLGGADITLGPLALAPDQGMFFPLALLLAQRAGERLARAEIINLVWPDVPEAQGRHSLRQALYRLRKAGLEMDDATEDVRIAPSSVDSDLTEVLRHDWPYRAEPADIERAVSVLPGFAPREETALAEWFDQLRARIGAQFRRAVLHRIGLARREGRWRDVDHWALVLLRGDPLNEEATLARAEATAMVGAKNAALEILDAYLREIGNNAKVIGLPARLLKRRISELTDTTGWRITATSAPFIGRNDLLARGQDALTAARGGESTVLWFVGPPGIGKSRLLRELARAARMAGWCVVRGGARPSYEDRPFALLTEILPHLLEAPGALGADPHALTLMRQMGRADVGEEPLAPEEARGRQYAVYLSWVELMDAVLGEAPLALVLDDVHWADPITLLMFARLLESRPSAKLAVILSARRVPTRDDGAAQRLLGAAQARVGPMTDEEMREFARAVGLGADADFEDVTRRLSAVSGGNPLFLGHLVHQHQTHRTPERVPTDLATLIDEQVRGLSREALRVLQACALLGQHATLPRVERVLGVAAPQLVSPFGELDDMLALPSEPGQPLTPHDLWTERVRHGMTAGVFRSLAVSAARVLEADAQEDSGIEIYWDAARLYQESGEKRLAYNVMMRCAEYLSRSGATLESCRAFGTAADVAESAGALYTALSGQLAGLHAMGEFASAMPVVEKLRVLCDEKPDITFTAEQEILAVEVAHYIGASGSIEADLARLALDTSLTPDCRLLAIRVGLATADNLHDSETISSLSEALASMRETPADSLTLLRARLIDQTLSRQFDLACESAEELVREARRRSNRTSLMGDLRFAAIPYRRIGDLSCTLTLLAEAQTIARKFGYCFGQFRAADIRAGVLLDYYQLTDARAALAEATELCVESLGRFALESLNITWAFYHLAVDDWDAAKQVASRIAPPDLSSRSRHAMLSAALRLRLATKLADVVKARALLAHLTQSNANVFRHAGADQIAVAVFEAMLALEGGDTARAFAEDYTVRKRQELFAPPRVLTATMR